MSLLQAKEEKEKQEKEVRLVEWARQLDDPTNCNVFSRKRSSPLPLRSQAKEAAKKEAERVADEKKVRSHAARFVKCAEVEKGSLPPLSARFMCGEVSQCPSLKQCSRKPGGLLGFFSFR